MRERDRRRKKGRELEEETEKLKGNGRRKEQGFLSFLLFSSFFSPSISSYFTAVHFHPVIVLAYIYTSIRHRGRWKRKRQIEREKRRTEGKDEEQENFPSDEDVGLVYRDGER